jgi:hypothetical protein
MTGTRQIVFRISKILEMSGSIILTNKNKIHPIKSKLAIFNNLKTQKKTNFFFGAIRWIFSDVQ